MKKRDTYTSLVLSMLSIVLSMAMLAGTTFAWFTVSVTSGNNIIVSGNLHVELEYSHTGGLSDDEWKPVTEKTNIFCGDPDNAADTQWKWEPGCTRVVYLRVKNTGSMALKYRLGVYKASETSGLTDTGDLLELSKYIEFGVVVNNGENGGLLPFTQGEDGRKAARKAVDGNAVTVFDGYSKNRDHPLTREYRLEAQETSEIIALVVYMPEECEANPSPESKHELSLGIKLGATQLQHEEDSFDSDYDEKAEYPIGSDARVAHLVDAGYVEVKTEDDFAKAMKNGEKIVLSNDMNLSKTLDPRDVSFTLDGNGHTITQADECTNKHALFDITGGSATVKNVTFDGIRDGAVIRTAYADLDMDNVTAEKCKHDQIQGLFRLLGKSTITNSTFKDNDCTMIVTLNYDFNDNDLNDPTNTAPQVVKNCVFEGNKCSSVAALYYANGSSVTIDGNKFLENTVSTTTAPVATTVYVESIPNNVVTNNMFSGNTATISGEKTICAAGGLVIGGENAKITGNAFVNNTASKTNSPDTCVIGNDVCAAVKHADVNLSGNYWGGDDPVEGTHYSAVHSDSGHKVILDGYLTTYGN